jgi:very-short-patch-repair endonuclease
VTDDRVRAQVEKWRDELLDLTGRNRLLRFRHPKTSSLEIDSPSAQPILDRLLTGRSREWGFHLPEEPAQGADVDPTAAVIGLGDEPVRGSSARPVLEALDRLGATASGDEVWLSFGAIRWRDAGAHTAALLLVPAEVHQGAGWRMRLRAHELVVNPALAAHFERMFDVDLGQGRYRIESAGIQSYLAQLRERLGPLEPDIDDRIGLISAAQHSAMLAGELDVTPGVLISESPRDGVLAALAGADPEVGLPLLPASARVLGVPVPLSKDDQPVLRTTKSTAKDVRAACAGLSRRAAQEFMDKGLWILYLGVGMLHWSDPADGRSEVQDSPLLLVPVRVEPGKGGTEWRLLPSDEEALVNPALWLKLESELGIELPEIDPEEAIDVAATLAAIRDAVASQPGWTVEERVVLSTFSFHKEAMYRDLRDNLERIVEQPLIAALAAEPGTQSAARDSFAFDPVPEERLDVDVPPERATTILDADASQRQCIAAARDGRSFVMDGPPGTGKSQTIANQIAELIAAGKTVLFVSEKAAALDVVYDRLANVGLHEYVLELHSHKTTRAAVAAALGLSLRRHPRPAPALTDHDLDEAQRRRSELSRYATALNDAVPALGGRSLHHLLGWIAELQHLPQAPVAGRPIADIGELSTIRDLAEQLRSTWEVIDRGEDFAWRGATANTWGAAVEQRVQAELSTALAALGRFTDVAGSVADDLLLAAPRGPAAAVRLARLVHHLGDRPADVPAEWLTDVDPADLATASSRTAERLRAIAAAQARATALAGLVWHDLDARAEQARRVRAALASDGLDLAGETRAADLRRLASGAGDVVTAATELQAAAADLTALLGLRLAEITLVDVERAGGVAEIAGAEQRPATAWLTAPQRLTEAQAAHDALLPLTTAEQDARATASAFEDSVLELDLPALATRFRDEHRGLKKLGGAYRTDRDALAATAPGLKPKEAIAHIDYAVAWQNARRALEPVAAQHAQALADAWTGPLSDMAVVGRRLATATTATELAGDRIVDAQRFAGIVSGARATDALLEPASRTGAAVARLRSVTPPALTAALELPLGAAAARLTELQTVLGDAAALVEAVDAVRGEATSLSGALEAHEVAGEVADTTATGDADLEAQDLLGERWSAQDADPDALEAAARWATDAQDMLDATLSRSAARRLVTTAPDPADLDAALTTWATARDAVLLEFDAARRPAVADDLDADATDARALLERLGETRGDIETWIAHAGARRALQDDGLEPALRFCADQRVPASQVVDVVRRSALEATADALLAERAQTLGPLRSVDRDRLVRDYAGLDRRVVGDAAHRVMQAANARRPGTIMGVAAIIANEAQKKKRHMPVAQLLAKTADVAQAIKPCLMMSPLSVSQFLSPDMRFDVVIFDEASQVQPCDAINALYRADAMIVAGDQKQLPPTNFFQRSTDESDEWTEDALDEFDSVLDLAKASGSFRSLSLRWHYRSRHEHLIAFSNLRFYGGDLVTFPSPAETADNLGVEEIRVDGVYRRGTTRDNPVEAQAVADRIFWHAERGQRSIGIVAFNEAQASLIDEVLRRDPRRQDPRFAALFEGGRLDGLFVKNLENVQGDERDIIIFSVGYGPDEHGKLTMNFGPVIYEGGWRRLNVAITRARRRVEVVCSFGAERLADGGRRNRGVDELRRYLEFAQRGPASLVIDDGLDTGGEPESLFEEAVVRTVRSWGYDVVSQVGTAGYRIDMAVRHRDHPGRFALGIECDGAMYHSSRVARDRDRLREQVLDGLGWTLHRIWGPSWYRDRSGEERRLKEAIERAMLEGPPGATPTVADDPVVVDFDDLDFEAPPTWAEPYTPAILPLPRASEVADMTAGAEIRKLLQHVVAEEGPIVEDLLIRRVIGAWGAMVTERRRQAVSRALAALAGAGTLVLDGDAYGLPNQRTDVVRIPADGDEATVREVRHIPDVELAHALLRLIADARLVSDDEALTRTARLFGWRRNGPAIQSSLTRVIEQLIDAGRLVRDGEYLRAEVEPARG